jgi:hypothetical protein
MLNLAIGSGLSAVETQCSQFALIKLSYLPVHEAIVLWNSEEREILIVATGRRPLLGTALLDEQELVIQFTEGGLVTIDKL